MLSYSIYIIESHNQMIFILQVLKITFFGIIDCDELETYNILISVEDQQKELVALRFNHLGLTRLYSQEKG